VGSPDNIVIIAYSRGFGPLTCCGFGSGSLGAWSRDLGLPAGGGWRRCHSAPLKNRTLCFAPLRVPGDGEHQSYPPPAGPSRWPGKATPLFSSYSSRDIAHRYAGKLWRPAGGGL